MQIEVNGTRLWFDVDGSALVPDGAGHVTRLDAADATEALIQTVLDEVASA